MERDSAPQQGLPRTLYPWGLTLFLNELCSDLEDAAGCLVTVPVVLNEKQPAKRRPGDGFFLTAWERRYECSDKEAFLKEQSSKAFAFFCSASGEQAVREYEGEKLLSGLAPSMAR